MIQNPKLVKPFWYIDGHVFGYDALSAEKKAFLDSHFYIAQSVEMHDAWAKYFVPINNKQTITFNLEEFEPIKLQNGVLFFYTTSSTSSKPFHLEKGNYRIFLKGKK